MFQFDRQLLLSDIPMRLALKFTPQRAAGLTSLLDRIETDPGLVMVRQAAYVLATIRWETGQTFQPIPEHRADEKTEPKYWQNQSRYWDTGFYGRGYVQITWERNYRLAGQRLAGQSFVLNDTPVVIAADTFVRNPDYVLHPEVAYLICSRGMREGWFTGKKLDDYIREGSPPDYVNARRIINGVDHAQDIASYANQFELGLRAALAPPPIPTVTPTLAGVQPRATPVAPPVIVA
jgi:putative chitinase